MLKRANIQVQYNALECLEALTRRYSN
jgi:hypothetical protein